MRLAKEGTPGAQQQAASALAELALVARNRDMVVNAGGVEPLIKLLTSLTPGIPETAARVLAHLSHHDDDDDRRRRRPPPPRPRRRRPAPPGATGAAAAAVAGGGGGSPEPLAGSPSPIEPKRNSTDVHGSAERRAKIHMAGGISRLISMLDGSNLKRVAADRRRRPRR